MYLPGFGKAVMDKRLVSCIAWIVALLLFIALLSSAYMGAHYAVTWQEVHHGGPLTKEITILITPAKYLDKLLHGRQDSRMTNAS